MGFARDHQGLGTWKLVNIRQPPPNELDAVRIASHAKEAILCKNFRTDCLFADNEMHFKTYRKTWMHFNIL